MEVSSTFSSLLLSLKDVAKTSAVVENYAPFGKERTKSKAFVSKTLLEDPEAGPGVGDHLALASTRT